MVLFNVLLQLKFEFSEDEHQSLSTVYASRSVNLKFPPYLGLRLAIPYVSRSIVYDIKSVDYDMARDLFKCTAPKHHEIDFQVKDKFINALKEDGWLILS